MGYDKTRVYDVETELAVEPVEPLDEMVTMVKRLMESDRAFTAAQWYAYGRLFYGDIMPVPGDDVPEDQVLKDDDVALGFAVQYQQMMLAFHDRKRTSVVKMEQAWANYEASAGGTIEEL